MTAYRQSYNLRVVTEWLEKNNIKYKLSSGGSYSLVQTGCKINLRNDFELSIQTSHEIAGISFAETALSYKNRIVYDICGYGDVKRHETPLDLFEEIKYLQSTNDLIYPSSSI